MPGFVFWFYLLNARGDLTPHNLNALQGHSEYFRVTFAVGGLTGLVLNRFPTLRKISVPPVLWVWLVLIAMFSVADLYLDYVDHGRMIYLVYGNEMSEVVELLIALASLLYLGLNARRIFSAQGFAP